MIYALIGIPGAGKSTLARAIVKEVNGVIVSRDYLRENLFGYLTEQKQAYYDHPDLIKRENLVSKFQDSLIEAAIAQGKDVIVDNTHVEKKYLDDLKKFGVPIQYVPVECDVDEAIRRDALRPSPVGEKVIHKYHLRYLSLLDDFDPFVQWVPENNKIVQDPLLKPCYVVDLDGTLCKNVSGRSPYDWDRVDEDELDDAVAATIRNLAEEYDIIICTARDGSCAKKTREWLWDHDIPIDGFFIRGTNDYRKDSVVKEEMWRKIAQKYYIVAIFDDRQQVVDHARRLGLKVFQVEPHKF